MKYVRIRGYDVSALFVGMLLIITVLSASVVALLYIQKDISHTANIKAYGNIELYSDSGLTTLLGTSYAWSEFDTSTSDSMKTLDFWLKNIGNSMVYVTWVSSGFDGVKVVAGFTLYAYYKGTTWLFRLNQVDTITTEMSPEGTASPTKMAVGVGEVKKFTFALKGLMGSLPSSLSFVTSIKASDS